MISVQGTVIHSHFYAENGQQPIGQVSVTKYSTDPRNLKAAGYAEETNDLISVTTTKKYRTSDTGNSKKTNERKVCDIIKDNTDLQEVITKYVFFSEVNRYRCRQRL